MQILRKHIKTVPIWLLGGIREEAIAKKRKLWEARIVETSVELHLDKKS